MSLNFLNRTQNRNDNTIRIKRQRIILENYLGSLKISFNSLTYVTLSGCCRIKMWQTLVVFKGKLGKSYTYLSRLQ